MVPVARNLESAFLNFIIKMPMECLHNVHPLFKGNYSRTFDQLEKEVKEKLSTCVWEEADIHNFKENTHDPFYRDLIVFMDYLIRREHYNIKL
jgi:hypothetical protein